jgi:Concanavalin A-like lectin/glucanases superfamily
MTTGTYTGQNQASWTVVGNERYVAYGGEFPTAGGRPQQGLVRFALRSLAPNKVGPQVNGSRFNPTLVSRKTGTVRVGWRANWDRDNEQLTYQVSRNGNTAAPVFQATRRSASWNRPMIGFMDTGLTPGATYRYRIVARDPLGNVARSDTVSIVAATRDVVLSSYANGVLRDEAHTYWRLGEPSGTRVFDWAGLNDTRAGSGVTRRAAGAISGDPDRASTFNGTENGVVTAPTSVNGPNSFTTEAWFRTTTTRGGKIIGFGDAQSVNSGRYDRHVYMTNAGRLVFGVYNGAARTVTTTRAYNDGAWHHLVATFGSGGMTLYVDGVRVGRRTDITVGQRYRGYWRVGGDTLRGWPSRPTSTHFAGTIDEVAIYSRPLKAAAVAAHYNRAR